MAKIGTWSTTPASNNSTPPDGWPEGQAPSTVNDCAREMMAALRTALQDIQWLDHGFFPITSGNDAFTVTGDQSAFLKAGGQLKLYDGGNTIYRSIATISASATTMVTMDAGSAVGASLSSFAVGILSNVNGAIPRRISVSSLEATVISAASATIVNLTVTGLNTTNQNVASLEATRISAASATITNLTSTIILTTSLSAESAAIGGYLSIRSVGPRMELYNNAAGMMWFMDVGNSMNLCATTGTGITATTLLAVNPSGVGTIGTLSASLLQATRANFATLTAASATINNAFIGNALVTTLSVGTIECSARISAASATITTLFATSATITTLSSTLISTASLSATNIWSNLISANSAFIYALNVPNTLTASSIVALGQIRCKNGTLASAAIAFDPTDLDTGPYWTSDGNISIACNSVKVFGFSAGGVVVTGRLELPAGSAALPSIYFAESVNDTGFYGYADGMIGVAINGSHMSRIGSDGYHAPAFFVTSDAATKKDWTPLGTDFVTRLANMKAGSYTKIKDETRSIGVPAQDLEQLYPEAVTEENGIKLANYGPAAMVSSIALAKRCEEQAAQIQTLMTRLTALEAKK